jgi:hypothetical protein
VKPAQAARALHADARPSTLAPAPMTGE